jgi:hypothetical protein
MRPGGSKESAKSSSLPDASDTAARKPLRENMSLFGSGAN